MSAILEQIKPETAEWIADQARAHGLSIDEYLRHLLKVSDSALPAPDADLEEFASPMASLAEDDVAPLPRDFSREDIYYPQA
jgi:hypothetical protein